MPISDVEQYRPGHWSEVKQILVEGISTAGFEVELVSADPVVGVIHARIVQNLYQNDIVVCDISSHNPNVMIELGLRLAFDKPTVIIKDSATQRPPFDIGIIEYIEYPADLRHSQIVEFKQQLQKVVRDTHEAFKADPKRTVFLGHFGILEPKQLAVSQVEPYQVVDSRLSEIETRLFSLSAAIANSPRPAPSTHHLIPRGLASFITYTSAISSLCFGVVEGEDDQNAIEVYMRGFKGGEFRPVVVPQTKHFHLEFSPTGLMGPPHLQRDWVLAYARKVYQNAHWVEVSTDGVDTPA